MRLDPAGVIALVLAVIGAINWGLVGAFPFDLVAALLGPMSVASRAVYIAVGIAGIVLAIIAATRSSNRKDAYVRDPCRDERAPARAREDARRVVDR